MSIEDILELIARQNHDFLNHLQVISGFLQLHKQEKAREYIREMGAQVERTSRILNSRPAEVAAALLTAMNRAGEKQVAVELPAPLNLAGGAVPGEVLGSLLVDLADMALSREWSGPTLSFVLQEQDRRYGVRLSFQEPKVASRALEEGVNAADALLARYGGRAGLVFDGGRAEIVLTIPRIEK